MPSNVFPPRYLPGLSDKWGREVERRDADKERRLVTLEQGTNNSARSVSGQLGVIARQLDQIVAQQAELQVATNNLQTTVNRLSNASLVFEDAVASSESGAGWNSARPSVTATSLSGKFLVSIFGTAAGSTSYFSFSAPGYPRDRILGASASAISARVSGLGGGAVSSTVFGQWVATFSANSTVTFYGEGYGTTEFADRLGIKIVVQPML